MKVRAVVVWFREPVQVGDEKEPKRALEFIAQRLPHADAAIVDVWSFFGRGWVKFTTAAGEDLVIPLAGVAWIEVGAETERP